MIGEETKTGSSPKQQPRHSAPKTTRFRGRAFVALGVALAAVVGAVLFFTLSGKDGPIPTQTGSDDVTDPPVTVPKFQFDVQGVQGIAAGAGSERGEVDSTAAAAAEEIGVMMSRMYRYAFLDPENWKKATYNEVLGFFDPKSQVAAQQDLRSLTLGLDGAEVYEEVPGARGTMRVRVLVDGDGEATTAVATTNFAAEATGKDGKDSLLVSQGDFFLRSTPNGWEIYAFDVNRFNQKAKSTGKDDTDGGGDQSVAPEETDTE